MARQSLSDAPSKPPNDEGRRTWSGRRLWPWTVPALMVLATVAIGYGEGILPDEGDFGFWRVGLLPPFIITYALVIDPFIRRLRDRAEQAVRPLAGIEEDALRRMEAESDGVNKRRSKLAALACGAGAVLVFHPWTWQYDRPLWATYGIVSQVVMFSYIGWLAYYSIVRAAFLSKLHRRPLQLDLFDSGQLEPVARWGLGVSFVFLLGISMSIAFLPVEALLVWENVVVCGALVLIAVLAFFMTMWSTHRAMAAAKARELALARANLGAASRELKERAAAGRLEGMEGVAAAISAWVAYEKRVREAPEWPYTAGIIGQLAVSASVPGVAYLAKVLIRYFNVFVGP